MMEHLPPAGWSDLARKSDIDHLAEVLDARLSNAESRLNEIVAGRWALGTVFSACFIAMFTILATM